MLSTPIDHALPLVALVVLACVWAARGTRWAAAIECSLPLLAAAAVFLTDERTRLLAYGVIVAAAFAGAALVAREYTVLVIAGVVLLRWIPLREVEVWRELVVLAGALVLFLAVDSSRSAERSRFPSVARGIAAPPMTPRFARSELHLIAVFAAAAVTPVHPGKAALFPLLLAALIAASSLLWGGLQPVLAAALIAAAFFSRWSLVPLLVAAAFALLVPFVDKVRPLAYAAAIALFAMWPWSGFVARALPVVTRFEPPAGEVRAVGWALGAGEVATLKLDGLESVHHLAVNVSAANAAGLPAGRVIGFIDAGTCTRAVRIGDVADFGFTRRRHFFVARNPLPRVTRGDLRDYGATSWVHGAGALGVACRGDLAALRFRGAADLPPGARMQIESIELPARR